MIPLGLLILCLTLETAMVKGPEAILQSSPRIRCRRRLVESGWLPAFFERLEQKAYSIRLSTLSMSTSPSCPCACAHTIGALIIITYTILGVPYYTYSIMGRKTLF